MLWNKMQRIVAEKKAIKIVGHVPKSDTGYNLKMSNYAGIIDYHTEELVITVKAGTRITEVARLLAEKKQALPFTTTGFTTIGGAYSAGNAQLRDAVLGVKIIDGQARLLRFGGQVMKNVAGYDVARLLVGSQGQLALICEISFKVIPQTYLSQYSATTTTRTNDHAWKKKLDHDLKQVFDPNGVFI